MEEEIWKDVEGYEGYYKISNLGRLKSLDRWVEFKDGRKYHYNEKIVIGSIGRDGYIDVKLSKNGKCKTVKLHRIVALAFVKNDDKENKTEVNHKDLDRTNAKASNLEWVTHQENIKYSHDLGSYNTELKLGIYNGRSKYTVNEVIEMRRLFDEENKTVTEIIKIFYPNATYKERKNKFSRIKDIVTRKTYTNI